MTEFFDFAQHVMGYAATPPKQVKNMACVLEALNAVTTSRPIPPRWWAGTVYLSLAKSGNSGYQRSLCRAIRAVWYHPAS